MKSAAHNNASNPTSGEGSSIRIARDRSTNASGRTHASGEHPRGHHAASERDTVRPRAPSSPELESAPPRRRPSRSPSTPELRLSREHRLEQKVREAESLLDRSDPRRRLLQAAAMRSDEALVDAVLSTLRDDDKAG